MYHPTLIEKRVIEEEKRLGYKLERSTIDQCLAAAQHLDKAYDPDKGIQTRKLKPDELRWIDKERALCKCDYPYFARRYAWLVDKNQQKTLLVPWESQEIAIEKIAQGELESWKKTDSNLWCWLKARRLGATQICGTMILHRNNFFANQMGIVASDKPESSLELFRRIKYSYDALPWWMQAHKGAEVKGGELFFDKLNSIIRYGHGRLKGGGLAQGSGTSIFHLSELPDWENYSQIDADFLPTVPELPTCTGWLESTARCMYDHWHTMFTQAWEGKHKRLKALFIPWYTEKDTYRMTPPEGWKPGQLVLAHAKKVERQSPLYCNGRTVRLTIEQMAWWEAMYNTYLGQGRLHVFFSEWASDHFEAFQNVAKSLFSIELINELRTKANGVPPMVFEMVGL